MMQPSKLEQQIARAREAIASWPDGKLEMMQLQGAEAFSSTPQAESAHKRPQDGPQPQQEKTGHRYLSEV